MTYAGNELLYRLLEPLHRVGGGHHVLGFRLIQRHQRLLAAQAAFVLDAGRVDDVGQGTIKALALIVTLHVDALLAVDVVHAKKLHMIHM